MTQLLLEDHPTKFERLLRELKEMLAESEKHPRFPFWQFDPIEPMFRVKDPVVEERAQKMIKLAKELAGRISFAPPPTAEESAKSRAYWKAKIGGMKLDFPAKLITLKSRNCNLPVTYSRN